MWVRISIEARARTERNISGARKFLAEYLKMAGVEVIWIEVSDEESSETSGDTQGVAKAEETQTDARGPRQDRGGPTEAVERLPQG